MREGDSVRISSPPSEERLEDARFADAVAPGAVVALSVPSYTYGVAAIGEPHASPLSLVAFLSEGGELRRRELLRLGEIGFTRIDHRSDAWRVFHRAVLVAPDCLDVRLDHAWRAPFDRRTGRFGPQRRLVLPTSGPRDAPGAGLAQVTGRYRLANGALVRAACGHGSTRGP